MPPTYPRKHGSVEKTAENNATLPSLNKRQEKFVALLLEGKSNVEAYTLAGYGKGSNPTSLKVNACKLKADPKVSSVLRHFQRIGLDRATVSMEDHLAELARGRELAYENKQISAGIQAEHYRGKAAGLYQDTAKLDVTITDESLISQLSNLFGSELADTLAHAITGKPMEAQPEPQVIDITEESRVLDKSPDWQSEPHADTI